ncbi:FABP family protein [Streptomyces sp. TRM 70351]|uniref:FABP family protein n=1 Tax=Streptomyces sp. TRM 70351 TaxID=3116552 RepID=UPI002E7B5A46|nr:FABP family protein [Streptomyces sp. TRM 70351]MEE1930411.1 FABP family protein [Streptomyces sp. TRM 70351]
MIEIPSDLHPDLVPLAFLLGNWTGAGVADFPGPSGAAEQGNFGQELSFRHDGRDFLEYASHTWLLDGEGSKVRPLESESGYWRISSDRKVEAVMVRDQGVAEVWYGELAEGKPQIELATDAVARLASAGEYSGGKRLYGYVKGDLMWVGEKATPSVPLRPYMSAQLKKVVDPREWARDVADLPDDGIAFFK